MAVFRVERTGDYTVMSNFHLKDKRLSLKAKGLLSQMLSLPDDWDYTLSGLSYINRESKDAIRSAVNELETAGYIRRRQTTDALRQTSAFSWLFQPVRSTLCVLYLPLGKRIRSPFSSRSYSFLDFAVHVPRSLRGRIVSMI